MNSSLRANKELFVLAALIALFLGAVAYYTRIGSEILPASTPSSLNAAPPGAKALFLLYQKLGYPVERLEIDWTALAPEAGLLLVIEPLTDQRPVTPAAIQALHRWVLAGGTALYCVTAPTRGYDPRDPLAGDVGIVEGSDRTRIVAPLPGPSPYTQSLSRLSVRCPVRLRPRPGAGYETLFRDELGIVAVHKALGKGHLVLIANDLLTGNQGIDQQDNALFLVDVAAASVGSSHKTILFDEYHHGAGLANASDAAAAATLWGSTPFWLKLTLAHFVGWMLLLLYNGNRRFGAARPLPSSSPPAFANYLISMAGLLHRASAADIAAQTLFDRFQRSLLHRLDLPPDADSERVVAGAVRRYGTEAQALGTLWNRFARIRESERITEQEMLSLAQQLEEWRRRFDLVGDER